MNKPLHSSNVVDTLSRPIRDLRISVIDNCNMRCTYCMPGDEYGEHYKFLASDDLLSYDEIARLTRIFAGVGVSKLRLTGGEPLLRRGLHELVAALRGIPGIEDIALTTNALLLRRQALALREAGLSRITVSLDSLDPEVFRRMTGRNLAVANVLDGIQGARDAGFRNIKINAVVQRGVNEDSVLDLVEYCRDNELTVRFIEYMDVGNRNRWRAEDVVPSRTLIERIDAKFPLQPLDKQYMGEVASRYGFSDGSGEIGFITSITEPFCGSCTRARLSADGKLYTCLFATSGSDLRTPLRSGESDEELRDRISGIWTRREDRYSELRDSLLPSGDEPKVEMYHIGG